MKQIGFTLIELLTVIAIISILAAVIFPTAIRAKDAAYRSSDMSHLNELRSALQLYRVDQGGYPPQLFGYVTLYASSSQPVPADQTQDYLYPKRESSFDVFKPAYDRPAGGNTDITTAVWPHVDNAHYGPSNSNNCKLQWNRSDTTVEDSTNTPLQFYKVDGFDVAPVIEPDGSTRFELRYALFWTGYGVNGAKSGGGTCGLGSSNDDVRQLGYSYPPDNTVVTWDSFFRDYNGNTSCSGNDACNVVQNEKREIILYLGGGARATDSYTVANRAWNEP